MSKLKQYPNDSEKKPFMQYSSPFNPFNSWKSAFHIKRMIAIKKWMAYNKNSHPDINIPKEFIPTPVYVTIDPSDACNHGCPWCISSTIQENDSTVLSKDILISLAEFIPKWTKLTTSGPTWVNAIVLAGGGEPLLNKHTPDFIQKVSELRYYNSHIRNEVSFEQLPEIALITNGELLTKDIAKLLIEHASWTGFSVDAGNTEDHKKQHEPKHKNKNRDAFQTIVDNIEMLCALRKEVKRYVETPLNVGYKFNIHAWSYTSMLEAARIAKKIGCDQIQFKPTYVDNPDEVYTPEMIEESQSNIIKARELYEDSTFKVIGMIHKVGPAWQPMLDFSHCSATPLGLIFSADGSLYLCCDRRGDPKLQLGRWHDGKITRKDFINELWGSREHYNLISEINLDECPRCTFRFYNQLMDQSIENDPMNSNFL